jgi:cysteine desulfuration protein SufE
MTRKRSPRRKIIGVASGRIVVLEEMLPEEKQRALAEQYARIEDVDERLALLVDRARKFSPLEEVLKIDAARVYGCTSRVWLVSALVDGRCRFRLDADSHLVRGLASLLCEIYDGAEPGEVLAVEPDILEQLEILPNLSPTRRHGLQQVRNALRDFAVAAGGTAR